MYSKEDETVQIANHQHGIDYHQPVFRRERIASQEVVKSSEASGRKKKNRRGNERERERERRRNDWKQTSPSSSSREKKGGLTRQDERERQPSEREMMAPSDGRAPRATAESAHSLCIHYNTFATRRGGGGGEVRLSFPASDAVFSMFFAHAARRRERPLALPGCCAHLE